MKPLAATRRAGALLLLGLAVPAPAQLGVEASLTSDYRLRGYSLSHGRPAVSGQLSYDDASGLFASGSATLFLSRDDGPEWMGGIIAAGYARQLRGGLTAEAGIARAQFSAASSLGRDAGYTEMFVGATGPILSARLGYSWDYFRAGRSTLYASLDAVGRREGWRAFGHVGALAPLDRPGSGPPRRVQYDWRAGVGRLAGPVNVELALTGGGPGRDFYDGTPHSRTALVGAIRFAF